jgi:hypothetical protein
MELLYEATLKYLETQEGVGWGGGRERERERGRGQNRQGTRQRVRLSQGTHPSRPAYQQDFYSICSCSPSLTLRLELDDVSTPELLSRLRKGLTRRERARLMSLSSTQRWRREAENGNHCMLGLEPLSRWGTREQRAGESGSRQSSTLVFALLMLTRAWVRLVAHPTSGGIEPEVK